MRTLAAASTSARDVARSVAAQPTADRIGPNAAIQLIAALRSRGETDALARLFKAAGREAWLDEPPQKMISSSEAARLHVGLRSLLPRERAEAALFEAGRLTGEYLLANRIPGFAQRLLKLLQAPLAARALMKAISANAWTFAGNGRFEAKVGKGAEATIHGNPLCEGLKAEDPSCVWHAAVLETLFRSLVSKRTRVTETQCCARGDSCCRFRFDWSGKTTPSVLIAESSDR